MSSLKVLTTSLLDAITGGRSAQKQPDANPPLEQAILSRKVGGVKECLAQGANPMDTIDGRLPLCVAIQNGKDEVAISLLQHYPSHSLQPPPHRGWVESLGRSVRGIFPFSDRVLKYCGRFLIQIFVVRLLLALPDIFYFNVRKQPACCMISTLVTETLYLLFRKCHGNFPFRAGLIGAQALDAFLGSKFQSERLLLEFLDRGLISSRSASLARLWGVAADNGYAEASRRLADLIPRHDMEEFGTMKLRKASRWASSTTPEALLEVGADPDARTVTTHS
ncbi:unnamed protein product [Clonostachys rosea]|uniref:Uncharacterized protein n=1 Tax=Bionectria ochroleuca TaxID=29856 RepID=A0ABY6UZL5_BIOOC|nr:unnamed protein product [Clonostachys rosea]